MRLFVALPIPTQLRENLAALIRELGSADSHPKWVNPGNLHVTLRFIGEVALEKLPELGDALAIVRMPEKVIAEFRGLGFFPNARRPSVFWVGIEPAEILAALAVKVNQALTVAGIPGEEKLFVPHLTIARFKETRLSKELRAAIERCESREFGTLVAGEFHLIESKRKSSGAEYTTLRSFRFAPEESKG
jgi:2'-5' RNA ligase